MVHEFCRVIRTCIASSDDTRRERRALNAVFDELNRGAPRYDQAIYLEILKHETHTYPSVGRAQERIFEQFGRVDLAIVIVRTRLGAGTEEEVREFLDRRERGELLDVMLYCLDDEHPVQQHVQQFRNTYQGLYRTYHGLRDFTDQVREQLGRLLREQPSFRSRPIGPDAYIVRDKRLSGNVECEATAVAQQSERKTEVVPADRSSLYYVLVEQVREGPATRQAIRTALESFDGNGAPFTVTGLYDTMGKWDVVGRFRGSPVTDLNGFETHVKREIQAAKNPRVEIQIVDVQREAPSLDLLKAPWSGQLHHCWLGRKSEYLRQRCQRFFLCVDLPAKPSTQMDLIKNLDAAIKNHSAAKIIESVAYSSRQNSLVFDIFVTCAQAMMIHELNELVETCIPSYQVNKYTLCCYQFEEISGNVEAIP